VTAFGKNFYSNIKITLLSDRWKSEHGTMGVSDFT